MSETALALCIIFGLFVGLPALGLILAVLIDD